MLMRRNFNHISLFVGLLFGILVAMKFTQYAMAEKEKQSADKKDFLYKGVVSEQLPFMESEYGYEPDSTVVGLKEGVIATPQLAARVACVVLSEIYGSANINRQKPFCVDLVNGNVWSVFGGQYPGKSYNRFDAGGCASIDFQKSDGMVLFYIHGK